MKVKASQWTWAEFLATIVAQTVKVLIYLSIVDGGLAGPQLVLATAALAVTWYTTTATFGVSLHTITDPLSFALLWYINREPKESGKRSMKGNVDGRPVRAHLVNLGLIILQIGLPMLFGYLYHLYHPLGAGYEPKTTGILGWAIFFSLLVHTVGYHVAVFPLIYGSDGFGASLASAAAYGAFGLANIKYFNVQLDVSADLAVAFAGMRPFAAIFLAPYAIKIVAAALTGLLYAFLWQPFYGAEAQRKKEESMKLNNISGVHRDEDVDSESDDLPIAAKSHHSEVLRHF